MGPLFNSLNQAAKVLRLGSARHSAVRGAGQPDVAGATHYVLTRLSRELAPHLVYHSVAHTRDEVVPAVERLAGLEGITGEALLLLRTAAYYHDVGFVIQRTDHEAVSAGIAMEVLPRFSYHRDQIDAITGMILATQLPQAPRNHLEAVLADADLAILGQDVFFNRNHALRAELAACGICFTDVQWYGNQLGFLRAHQYFTAAACSLYNARKQQHIAQVERLLAQAQSWE